MPAPSPIIVLCKQSLGGIAVFWDNVGRDDDQVQVCRYSEGPRTEYDEEQEIFFINRFDPLESVYRQWSQRLDLSSCSTIVANEAYELGFLASIAPAQPIAFIVHVNHEHSYQAAAHYGGIIDHFFCVSDTAAVYLRARGFRNATFFRYSTFLTTTPTLPKTRKVVYVGRLDPDKNIGETLALLKFFRDRGGYQVRLIGNGPEVEHAKKILTSEELLIGIPRDQVLAELASASFLCHNSYVEGLPIIHMEASYFGLGIICNYIDKSMYEVVGDNTLLWSDPEALLKKMASFRFQTPPGPPRINNPGLNQEFLSEVRAVTRMSRSRFRQRPRSILDRLPFVPDSVIRKIRRWRSRI